eukprot:COSAG01_NODE_32176_length_585_cov_0.944444_2_plen_115_part_01
MTSKKDDASDEFQYQESRGGTDVDDTRLGDLLSEKSNYQFSWSKTIVVLFVVVGVIFISLSFLFNLGKKTLIDPQQLALKAKVQESKPQKASVSASLKSDVMQAQLVKAIRESAS